MWLITRWIDSWGSTVRPRRRRRRANRLRGQLETLETRNLLANVLTYHNDAGKTGQNLEETILTRANVNVSSFGKVFSVRLDGDVYAQPLVKEDVAITVGPQAGTHDVVFVATQHGSIYAIDAKARTGDGQGIVLWKRSLLNVGLPGATAVEPIKRDDVGAGYPETVITGTPVIDAGTNTLYVLSKTRETVNGKFHFVQRIHALNISSGASRTPAVLIGDTVHNGGDAYTNNSPAWVNGTGDGDDGQGHVYFNAMREHTRTALTLFKGVVYAGWASHESIGPYHGWVLGFDAQDLSLRAVFCTTPNGGLGGIWQSGGGFASDGTALYFQTGNGTFDGNNGNLSSPADSGTVTGLDANGFPKRGNYGNSMVKVVPDSSSSKSNQHLNGWGLKVVDYFTPFNQKFLEERDLDLGSGAPMMLPDEVGSAAHPHLLVGAGKQGIMYLVDRNNMGKFGTKNNIVQTVEGQLSSSFDTPAYYDGKIYYVEGFGGTAKTFSIANGVMSSVPTSRSLDSYAYAGSTPSISANGDANGIVWDVDRGTNQLRAYSSDTYASQLYHSGQAAGNRDLLGAAATFQVPTVANGRVYLGTAAGASSTLVAYGLIQPPTAKPAAPSNLRMVTVTGTQAQLAWQANDTSPNVATGYLLQKSGDGGQSWSTVSSGVATTFTVGGLQKSTTYKFRVAATNPIGASAFSNVITVTTTAAAGGFDFSGGFGAATGNVLALNGAPVNNGALVLTNGVASQFRNVFSKVMQDITKFTTSFEFQISPGPSSHGFAFVIQSDTPTAETVNSGANIGEGLGYGAVQHLVYPHSAAIKFDLFRSLDQYERSGVFISTTGLYLNGATPTTPEVDLVPAGIDLHSGHRMRATIDYDFAAKKLTLTIADVVTQAQFTRVFEQLDLPQSIGGGAAYVGFTAASSKQAQLAPTQRILTWKFASEGPPPAPTNLRTQLIGQVPGVLTPPPLGVVLHWSAVPKATGYIVERRFGLVGNFNVIASLAGGVTQYTDANAGTQAHYFYRMKAVNGAGESPYSSEAVASTPGRVPTPRFGQPTEVTATSIAMKWTDFATNEDGFHIRRRSGASDYTLVAVLPPNPGTGVLTFVDSGLTPGTNYDYHIEAFNLVGYSDYTGVNTDTPALSGPPRAFFEYLSSPRKWAAGNVQLRFSEPVTGFSKADLKLTRGGAAVDLSAATIQKVNDRTYSINLSSVTGLGGDYQLALLAATSGIRDAGNAALTTDASLSWTKDSVTPQIVSFEQVTPGPDVQVTNAYRLVYRVRFNEPVSAIGLHPILSFGLTAQSVTVDTTDNKTFTITLHQVVGTGTLSLALNSRTSAIRDHAGNVLALSAYPEQLSITVDRNPPSVTAKVVVLERGAKNRPLRSSHLLATDSRVLPAETIFTVVSVPEHLKLKLGSTLLKVNSTFTQLDINTDRITYEHDDSTAGSDSLTFTVSDGLNSTVVKSLPFSIVPFNVAPKIPAVPAQQTLFQTPLIIHGVQVADPDAGQDRLRMSITTSFGNSVTLASTAGLTFSAGTGFQNMSMTFSGTLTNINQALKGLRFVPRSGYTGSAAIDLFVSDLGNGGTRIVKNGKQQISVSIMPPDWQPTTLNVLGTNANDSLRVNVGATEVEFVLGTTTRRFPRGELNTINVYGEAGDDRIIVDGTRGLDIRVFGGDGNDELTAVNATTSINLFGGRGQDVLTGGAGGDVLIGGPGSDRLLGGAGSDRYLFANAGSVLETDTVVELAKGGVDALDFSDTTSAVTVDLGSDTQLALQAGRKVITGGAGQGAHFEGILGGSGKDVLRGNNGANYISGHSGDDVLLGLAGNDTLLGMGGNDFLLGGSGNDALLGGAGNDRYVSGNLGGSIPETDTLTELPNEGSDTLDFAGLSTAVTVDLDNNTLSSQINRTLVVAASGQFANFENAIGGSGGDTLRGNAAGNTLTGNAGQDLLLGFGGADTLKGGDGNDRIAGGDGFDLLIGGRGDDSFEFADVASDNAETDTVIEWANQGDDDHLDFRGVTTSVTVNLNGNPLATHELRTVVPGASAELERVLRRPAAAAATSQGSATTKRRPSYPELVDQFLADKDDSIA